MLQELVPCVELKMMILQIELDFHNFFDEIPKLHSMKFILSINFFFLVIQQWLQYNLMTV